MKHADTVILSDIQTHLLRQITPVSRRNVLLDVFALWMLGDRVLGLDVRDHVAVAARHEGGQRTYQDVACLGYASAAGMVTAAENDSLAKGLEWVAGREPLIGGSPAGFCTDMLALLGIALGAQSVATKPLRPSLAQWMGRFMPDSVRVVGEGDWQTCVLAVAAGSLGVRGAPLMPATELLADVRAAFMAKGLWSPKATEDGDRDIGFALSLMKSEAFTLVEPVRSVFRLAAFDWAMRPVPTLDMHRPTTQQLIGLLRRVPAALKRWTWEDRARTSRKRCKPRRWHVENEYHVQNLLWAILAPLFPDLSDEEYTPPVGPLQPRADILIPSMKLIIEVKFMRDTWSSKDVIEQIAADAGLYLGHGGDYDKIVVFLWDASCRIEQHDSIRSGLCKLHGIADAVIMSCPASMRVSAST